MKSGKHDLLLVGLLPLTLCACSSSDGNGDGEQPPVDPVVETTDTDVLKSNAAANIGRSLGISLDGLEGSNVVSSGGSSSSSVTSTIDVLTGETTSTIVEETPATDEELVSDGQSMDADSLLLTSLGLEDGSNATTTRVGNRITIDPDEVVLCRENALDQDTVDAQEVERCETLLRDVIVQINPTSEDAGTVTYLFQSTQVVAIGYGPNTESFELFLPGFKQLAETYSALDTGSVGDALLPETLQGALKLTAIVTNDVVGAEAGSMALEVSQPLNIVDSRENFSYSLGNGTLLKLTADAVAKNGSIEFDTGAARLTAPMGDNDDITTFSNSGFTGRAELSEQDGLFAVSNLGFKNGPVTVTINSAEALRMTMSTFGFGVSSDDNGELVFDGNLDLDVLIDYAGGEEAGDALNAMLSMSAASGTALLGQSGALGESVVKVTRGGPFSFSYSSNSGDGGSSSESISVGEGQCFSSSTGEFADEIGLTNCVD